MNMPNFLILGAAKAGTSSLSYYLQQHPQIYMSQLKEPKFFALENEMLDYQGPDQGINHNSVTSIEEYRKLFEAVSTEIAIGEISPIYLYSSKAASRIKHYLPDVKLIAILRNPVERAFSSFLHLVLAGYEDLSFSEALQAEEMRIAMKWAPLWHYKAKGFYYQQLKKYFDTFNSNQIKVYLYEDLYANSLSLIKDIYQYLGVDHGFTPNLRKLNASSIPKSKLLHQLLTKDNFLKSALKLCLAKPFRTTISHKVKQLNLQPKPELSSEVRQELVALFRNDIMQLQKLINKDLSQWLK
jgi:hypothetical protein